MKAISPNPASRIECTINATVAARAVVVLMLLMLATSLAQKTSAEKSPLAGWEPLGLSGGGAMFAPAISPVNPNNMMIHCDMSAAYVSHDGGRNWAMIHFSQLSSNTGVRPCWHPTEADTVFSPSGWSSSIIKVSHDAGITWQELSRFPDPLKGEIAIDPGEPSLIFAGAGEKAYRSTNGGRTFQPCDGPAGTVVGFAFDLTSQRQARTCFAATDKGIWRSGDGGHTWSSATANLNSDAIVSFCGGSNVKDKLCVLYCTVPTKVENGELAGGVYRSDNRGVSWVRVMGKGINLDVKAFDGWSMGEFPRYRWVVTSNDKPLTAYTFNTNTGIPPPHHATVYRTDDGGATWRASFQADPRYGKTNVAPYYISAEDGQFYQDVPNGVAPCSSDSRRLMFVDGGRCFITEDGADSWFCGHTRLASGQNPKGTDLKWVCNGLVVTTTWNFYFDPFIANRCYICYTDIAFAISDDLGKTWRWWRNRGRPSWRNTCYELAFDPKEKGKAWAAFSNVHDIPNANIISNRHRSDRDGGICLTTDHCESWKQLEGGLPKTAATCVVIDPKSPKDSRTLYAGFFGSGVYKSVDDGKTWLARNAGLGSSTNMRVSKLVLSTDGSLFAVVTALMKGREFQADGVGLYRSTDGAASWQLITKGQDFLWPKDITVDPDNDNTIYLSNSDANGRKSGGLYRTKDGGKSWKLLCRLGPEHFGCYLHPKKQSLLYVTLCESAPKEGLWVSKDGGDTFEPVSELPFQNIMRVTFDPRDTKSMYVTTFGGSVWRGPQ